VAEFEPEEEFGSLLRMLEALSQIEEPKALLNDGSMGIESVDEAFGLKVMDGKGAVISVEVVRNVGTWDTDSIVEDKAIGVAT